MYVVVGEEQGVPRQQLQGTVQNDVLKEYIARGTYIYPGRSPRSGWSADLFRFVADEGMNFNPISISGYHMREAGATAAQEVGFTLANALEYVRPGGRGRARGEPLRAAALVLLRGAQRSLRGGRQVPRRAAALGPAGARAVRADDQTCRLRFHTQTGGVTLQAQQPLNNVVRVTRAGARRRARRHPVAAHQRLRRGAGAADRRIGDAGAPDPADPRPRERAGRRWSIRWPGAGTSRRSPTGSRPRRAPIIEEVDRLGGAAAAISRGWFQEAIARSAWEQQQAQESGQQVVVGVNRFTDGIARAPGHPRPDFSALAAAAAGPAGRGEGPAG